MKKIRLSSSFILLPALLLGCQQNNEVNIKKPYSSEDAINNEDVVVKLQGKISHLDTFERFLENVNHGTKDKIRITMYTIEGDPIFYHLNYNSNKIQYTFDNSQDAYAGSGKGSKSTSCSNIQSKTTEHGAEYYLTGCSSKEVGDTFYLRISK